MKRIAHHITRFEQAFNRRFGWFFTNGNKNHTWSIAIAATTLASCHFEQACGTIEDRYMLAHECHVVLRNDATGEHISGPVSRPDWDAAIVGQPYCLNVMRYGFNTTAQ